MSDVFDYQRAELERKHLLGAPIYFQFFLMRDLIPSVKFTSYMIYFAEKGRLPDYLTHEVSIWADIADYWLFSDKNVLSPERASQLLNVLARSGAHQEIDLLDPQFERLYHTYGKALVLATQMNDRSLPALLARVNEFAYPHYTKKALMVAREKGSEHVQSLTTALLRNSQRTGAVLFR
ncbi:MAG: hypothetical protein AB7I18_13070 [Candidatus Berkiella sp.]